MREFKSHTPSPVGARLTGARTRPTPVDREQLERAAEAKRQEQDRPREIGGPEGPEPTRYGDWERKGICVDF